MFNSRIKLGGGIQLSTEILAKCFASWGGDGKYCMACEEMGIEYEGKCIFVVLTAFGIYDSEAWGMLADKHDIIAGRMQFSLTIALKASLSKFIFDNFPTKCVSDR